ncbi:MAG: hypothetical protein PHP25_01675 [Candidatus Moranbacteria bacterium]|nr:hypothetical protein [Candidatus Moranbacteria bacterium]
MKNTIETRPETKEIKIDPDKQVEIFLDHLKRFRGVCKEINIDPEQQIKIFLAKLKEYNLAEPGLRTEAEQLDSKPKQEILSVLLEDEAKVQKTREKVFGTMTAQLA